MISSMSTSQSIRVILVPNSYPPQLGGLEIAVANVARELRAGGHDVTVVTTSPSLCFSKTEESGGVTVHCLPFALPRLVFRAGRGKLARSLVRSVLSPILAPFCLLELVRIIRRERPELVNLHYIAANAFYVLASQRFVDFRLVVNLHGNDIERYSQRSWPSRWLTRTALHRADMVLSNSANLLAGAERILPEVRCKSVVVGNGVHPEEFATKDRFQHDTPYILSIGNFIHKKGFDNLIRAFRQIRREHPDVDLIIAGDGHEREACRRLAVRLGVNDALLLLGSVQHSQVPALLNGCEIFVLPSRQEPFGIVVLEAMAAGKPVVATRVGGVPEIVTDMKDGLLVEPESPGKLAHAVKLLLSEPDLMQRLGRNGRETVKKRFSWRRVVNRYVEAYQTVLDG